MLSQFDWHVSHNYKLRWTEYLTGAHPIRSVAAHQSCAETAACMETGGRGEDAPGSLPGSSIPSQDLPLPSAPAKPE
jgi:hypothetical protein